VLNKFLADSSLADSDVLRRYLDVPRFISFQKTQSLYLCRSDLFPDKFEGSFTLTVKEAISNSYKKNRIKYTYEKFKRKLREGVFLNCWAHGVDDNMALWWLYGKTNDCVAITTTVARLKNALRQFDGEGQLFLRKVEYIKHWRDPDIEVKPYSNVFKYKAVGYSFENEVRIILDRFASTYEAPTKDEGIILPVDAQSFLHSIVVSPECSPWFKTIIEDILQRYDLSCPVRNSSMAKEPI
jgi:hypothetical protein